MPTAALAPGVLSAEKKSYSNQQVIGTRLAVEFRKHLTIMATISYIIHRLLSALLLPGTLRSRFHDAKR